MPAANPYLHVVEGYDEHWVQPVVNTAGAIAVSAGLAWAITTHPSDAPAAHAPAVETHWQGFGGTVIHTEAMRQVVHPSIERATRSRSTPHR